MAIYSDIPQFHPREEKVYDLESIYQSIHNILSTPKGTRLFLPEFGSDVENLLFEPMISLTEARIEDEIIGAIDKWEDRVLVENVSVKPSYRGNEYRYEIVFKIVGMEEDRFEQTGQLIRS